MGVSTVTKLLRSCGLFIFTVLLLDVLARGRAMFDRGLVGLCVVCLTSVADAKVGGGGFYVLHQGRDTHVVGVGPILTN